MGTAALKKCLHVEHSNCRGEGIVSKEKMAEGLFCGLLCCRTLLTRGPQSAKKDHLQVALGSSAAVI